MNKTHTWLLTCTFLIPFSLKASIIVGASSFNEAWYDDDVNAGTAGEIVTTPFNTVAGDHSFYVVSFAARGNGKAFTAVSLSIGGGTAITLNQLAISGERGSEIWGIAQDGSVAAGESLQFTLSGDTNGTSSDYHISFLQLTGSASIEVIDTYATGTSSENTGSLDVSSADNFGIMQVVRGHATQIPDRVSGTLGTPTSENTLGVDNPGGEKGNFANNLSYWTSFGSTGTGLTATYDEANGLTGVVLATIPEPSSVALVGLALGFIFLNRHRAS